MGSFSSLERNDRQMNHCRQECFLTVFRWSRGKWDSPPKETEQSDGAGNSTVGLSNEKGAVEKNHGCLIMWKISKTDRGLADVPSIVSGGRVIAV